MRLTTGEQRSEWDALGRTSACARAALTVILMLLDGGVGWADSGPAFFPTPPPKLTYKTLSGVLVDYAIGMKSGTITIRVPSGARAGFLVGATMTINGKTVHCLAPPNNGQSPPPELCPDWPASLKIGTTSVTVFFWTTTFQGNSRYVTDKITFP